MRVTSLMAGVPGTRPRCGPSPTPGSDVAPRASCDVDGSGGCPASRVTPRAGPRQPVILVLGGIWADTPTGGPLGQLGWDLGLCPPGLAGPQTGEAVDQVGVEPPLDGPGGDGQVGGDVLVGPAPVGQPDDLEAVSELAVSRLTECLLKGLGVGFGEMDADHGRARVAGWGESLPSIRPGQHHRACE